MQVHRAQLQAAEIVSIALTLGHQVSQYWLEVNSIPSQFSVSIYTDWPRL